MAKRKQSKTIVPKQQVGGAGHYSRALEGRLHHAAEEIEKTRVAIRDEEGLPVDYLQNEIECLQILIDQAHRHRASNPLEHRDIVLLSGYNLGRQHAKLEDAMLFSRHFKTMNPFIQHAQKSRDGIRKAGKTRSEKNTDRKKAAIDHYDESRRTMTHAAAIANTCRRFTLKKKTIEGYLRERS